MIIIDRSRLLPFGRSSNRSMPCVRSHPMKDVTERLEGEAPTRRVFQQQLFMTLAVSTVLCSVQAAPQGPEALGSKLTPWAGRSQRVQAGIFLPGRSLDSRTRDGATARCEENTGSSRATSRSTASTRTISRNTRASCPRTGRGCSRGFPAIAWMCIRPVGPVALRTSWSRTPGRTLVSPSSMLPASLWTRLTFRASRSPCRVPVPR